MNIKNGKYDLVTVIGVACSVIALVLIILFKPGGRPAAPVQESQVNGAAAPLQAQNQPAVPAPTAEKVTGTAVNENGFPAANLQAMDVTAPRSRGGSGTNMLSGNAKMLPSVDLEGNGIVDVELTDYKVDLPKDGVEKQDNVRISSTDYPFLCITGDWITKYGFGKAERIDSSADGKSCIVLRRKSADGKLILNEKWILVNPAGYELSYTVEIENTGSENIALGGSYIEGGSMPSSVTPARKAGRGESAGGVTLGSVDGKPVSLLMRDLLKMKEAKRSEIGTTPARWTAVHSKYFLLSMWLMGDEVFAGAEVAQVPAAPSGEPAAQTGPRYHVRGRLQPVMVEAGKKHSWNVMAYAGPKKFSVLSGYGMDLESVMEMDRFFFWRPRAMSLLSEYLLKMLVWLSEVFPKNIGYGLGVILLTVLVKLIFWPLSHKSTKSMRKMAQLKPQIDEIKAKYKDDPQTMYRKQQELFKQNGVSQLGGCMPLLLQIPVFFALFNTFRNAIELRHASFLWAYDLSMPDTLACSPARIPIRPLALVMGALMYYQQKLTPNPDPQQAKMMSYMSIFFILLFYGMPSALTLYLSVSYLLGILQTVVTNKLMPPIATTAAVESK